MVHATSPAVYERELVCLNCSAPLMPAQAPAHGFVLSYGAILSDGASWFIVDTDQHSLARVEAFRSHVPGQHWENIDERVHQLTPPDETKIIDIANNIWASHKRMPSIFISHSVWELSLLDGNNIREEGGAGKPAGLAAALDAVLVEVWNSGELK